jgi:protein SCO1
MPFLSVWAGAAFAHEPDAHGHHQHGASETKRSLADYPVPDLALVREDGKPMLLAQALAGDGPVVLNFIYTTCTSVCPLTSQTFADVERKLGPARDGVQLVSISIDPEQDTPARLSSYAQKFGAGAHWHFYTGTLAASVAAQRAFNVYRGSKMDHAPVTLVRTAPGKSWVRLDGFASADEVLDELRASVAQR